MKAALFVVTLAATCLLASEIAWGQPLLDRVLDRVQEDLNELTQPTPAGEESEPEGIAPDDEVAGASADEPGYLGVIADDRQEQGGGVRVLEVVSGGPAAKGGIVKNDLITAINTRPIRTMDEMARILSAMPAGTRLTFGVRRGEGNQDVTVTLTARPGSGERRFERFGRLPEQVPAGGLLPAPSARPKLGVRTMPVTAAEQQQLGLPSRDGAIVVEVTQGSRAEDAGIHVGDVIIAADGHAVRNPDQLADLVGAAASRGHLTMKVFQNGQVTQVDVPFGGGPASRVVGRPEAPPTSEDDPEDLRLAPGEPVQDESPFDAIERRLQQLEDRIEKLEEAGEHKT